MHNGKSREFYWKRKEGKIKLKQKRFNLKGIEIYERFYYSVKSMNNQKCIK